MISLRFENLLLIFCYIVMAAGCVHQNENEDGIELNEPIGDDEAEMQGRKKLYMEMIHRTAPGTDWKSIEIANRQSLLDMKMNLRRKRGNNRNVTAQSFANGIITASWLERGSRNIAGNVRYMDYVPASNSLYLVSDGGTLWQGNADFGNWQVLNQDNNFNPEIIKVIGNGLGGQRILASADNNMLYSDDNGGSFTPSTGISFPIAWGGNYIADLQVMNDASNTIYCLTRPWDPSPWAARYWLYRSTDRGRTYTQIYTFDFGSDSQLSLYSPYASTQLYALDVNNTGTQSTLYSINGTTVSILNNSNDLPTNKNCVLKGFDDGGNMILYSLIDNNKLYMSGNLGLNWTLQSNLPENAWDRLEVSLSDPQTLFYGGVNAYRSTNAGINWTKVTGGWGAYYGDPSTKLHADMMQLQCFRKADNTEFTAINCHGGYYISYDNLLTVSNKSLLDLNTAQTWDVITDRANNDIIYLGAQDQGIQVGRGAVSTNAVLDFVQFYSGDYGQLVITDNPSRLWTEYPGGVFSFYKTPALISSYYGYDFNKNILGTQKPNAGWMLPAANTGNLLANEILIGGGNMSGGSGSYLIKFKAQISPLNIIDSQYSFNFRANSNNGASGISAIEASLISNKIFVATEDGTFFYSNNNGADWTKSTGFTGPSAYWLYGSCILSSQLNDNLLWYCGSGYSNPGVYKSVDGGVSFTAISNGLPSTLVHKIVATPDEQLLFAATEAGPYVYVVANNQWYSLTDTNTPVVDYFTVEYLPEQRTARFGTYGRGIWDYKIEGINLDQYICPGSSIVYSSNISGAAYQWQVNTGSGFVNITNNIFYSGANSWQLQLKNIPSSFYGYQYRCNVAGVFSNTFTLKLTSYWKGGNGTAWENELNWNCGSMPDGNTDVIINTTAPTLPQVNSDAFCRSINVRPGTTVRVNAGSSLTVTH